jgi:hypothetical protein
LRLPIGESQRVVGDGRRTGGDAGEPLSGSASGGVRLPVLGGGEVNHPSAEADPTGMGSLGAGGVGGPAGAGGESAIGNRKSEIDDAPREGP